MTAGLEAVGIDAGRRNDERPLACRVVVVRGVRRHGRRVAVAPAAVVVGMGVVLAVMVLHVGLVSMMGPFGRRRQVVGRHRVGRHVAGGRWTNRRRRGADGVGGVCCCCGGGGGIGSSRGVGEDGRLRLRL